MTAAENLCTAPSSLMQSGETPRRNIPTMTTIVSQPLASSEFIVCGEKRWLPAALTKCHGGRIGIAAKATCGLATESMSNFSTGPLVVRSGGSKLN